MDRRAFVAGTLGLLAAPLAAEAQRRGRSRGSATRLADAAASAASRPSAKACASWATSRARTSTSSTAGPRASRSAPRPRRRACSAQGRRHRGREDRQPGAPSRRPDDPDRRRRSCSDPVASGFVASLARPGGNITGVPSSSGEIAAKRLRTPQETVPKRSREVAVLGESTIAHPAGAEAADGRWRIGVCSNYSRGASRGARRSRAPSRRRERVEASSCYRDSR